METTITRKISELTPDFIDGLNKVFSPTAVVQLVVQYGPFEESTSGKDMTVPIPETSVRKRRGPKPGFKRARKASSI